MVTAIAPPDVTVAYPLWPKQGQLMDLMLRQNCHQCLYGGAAGGGKSHALRALAYAMSQFWPGCRIAIFRLTSTELFITQIEPWLMEMAKLGYDLNRCWTSSRSVWRFPNGSTVWFLHIDQTLGAKKWLSAEFAAILIDEGVTFPPKDIRLLYSRIRRPVDSLVGDQIPWHPIMVIATNPGGQAHEYLKETFVEPGFSRPGEMFDGKTSAGSIIPRAFLPSLLKDNPSLTYDEYVVALEDLDPQERKQMLDGNWDWFEGKAFPELMPEIHLVKNEWFAGVQADGFDAYPDASWKRLAGLDHGLQAPTAVEWSVQDPDANFITYMEHYEAKKPVPHHVKAMRGHMARDRGLYDTQIYYDPQMSRKNQANGAVSWSLAHEYAWGGRPEESGAHGRSGLSLKRAALDRQAGFSVMRRLYEPDMERMFPDWHPRRGEFGSPRWFISEKCPNLWREMNNLQLRPVNEETNFEPDVAKLNDHAYDGARFHLYPFDEWTGRSRGRRRRHAFKKKAA